jgi:hypothetical protein
MTTKILARYHCATETIEACSFGHIYRGGYHFGVRFYGGKHANLLIRCCTECSAIRLFDEAVAARKQHAALWWLDQAA